MSPALIFVILLTFLFLLSNITSQSLGLLTYSLTKSKKAAVLTLAAIFLPGTVVHEFAHAAVAQGLGIYVGEIDLIPKVEGQHIKLGSVQVAQTDPIRHFLIGIAPLIIGFLIIFTTIGIYSKFELTGFLASAILFYILFQIGNTMFSSKRDMEGTIELAIAITLVLGFLYIIGIKQIFSFAISASSHLLPFFKMSNQLLLKIIVIDLVVIGIAKLFNKPIKFQA
ncbi:MAG TPA: hypothetical protein VLE91_05150 [Candidatus Saccharimonadales bacterium]|nr:hypothetical protein [Candidatus Saccharimonadales bacterium]